MAVLYRFVVDMVCDDELSGHRLEELGKELSDTLHISIVDPEDGVNLKVEKFVDVHFHDSTENRCRRDEMLAYDDKNGDSVVAEAEAMSR